jgi:hypothetical protein
MVNPLKIPFMLIKFFLINVFFFEVIISASAQEPILENPELFSTAEKSIKRKDYRKAEAYLYALIQRNSDQYKTDARLRKELNEALEGVRKEKIVLAGTEGNYDQDAFLGYSQRVLVVSNPNINFRSATYIDDGRFIKYTINRIGDQIWWLGSPLQGGRQTIMHGKISSNFIIGDWSYMPIYGSDKKMKSAEQ